MFAKINEFLILNGWERDPTTIDFEYISYYKKGNITIDINEDEIVLIGDIGDFAHFVINDDIIYTLLGYLLACKYLSIDYKLPKMED